MFGKKKKEKNVDNKSEKACSNCSNEKSSNMTAGSRSTKSCSNCGTREKSAAPHPTKACSSRQTKSCGGCGSKTTKNCKQGSQKRSNPLLFLCYNQIYFHQNTHQLHFAASIRKCAFCSVFPHPFHKQVAVGALMRVRISKSWI